MKASLTHFPFFKINISNSFLLIKRYSSQGLIVVCLVLLIGGNTTGERSDEGASEVEFDHEEDGFHAIPFKDKKPLKAIDTAEAELDGPDSWLEPLIVATTKSAKHRQSLLAPDDDGSEDTGVETESLDLDMNVGNVRSAQDYPIDNEFMDVELTDPRLKAPRTNVTTIDPIDMSVINPGIIGPKETLDLNLMKPVLIKLNKTNANDTIGVNVIKPGVSLLNGTDGIEIAVIKPGASLLNNTDTLVIDVLKPGVNLLNGSGELGVIVIKPSVNISGTNQTTFTMPVKTTQDAFTSISTSTTPTSTGI